MIADIHFFQNMQYKHWEKLAVEESKRISPPRGASMDQLDYDTFELLLCSPTAAINIVQRGLWVGVIFV